MPNLPQPLIDKMILIGSEEDFAQLSALSRDFPVARSGQFMRQGPDFWRDIATQLNDEDLVSLIKALTVAEREIDGYKAGSVAPVIWLFRILQARVSPESLPKLVDWILCHTENDYLPWGASNHGAKSLDEYKKRAEAVALRSMERMRKEEDRQQTATERKAQTATRNLMNAVRRRDIAAICSLRLKGADVHKQNDSGVSVLQQAEKAGDTAILEALTKDLVKE